MNNTFCHKVTAGYGFYTRKIPVALELHGSHNPFILLHGKELYLDYKNEYAGGVKY